MDSYDLAIWGYRVALGALCIAVFLKGETAMKRTAATLFGVYLIQLFLAGVEIDGSVYGLGLWPDTSWDLAMIGVNLAAARLVLWQPAGRIQAVTGAIFIPQALIHLGRVINGENANMDFHFWGLCLLGFAQLFLVGGWWLNDRLARRRRDHRSDPVASPAYRKSMDP